MEDKLYMKVREDGLMEKNPTAVFGIGMVLYMVVFFGGVFLLPRFLAVPWLLISMLAFTGVFVFLNWRSNLSASTAFIRKDGVFYAVQVLYTNGELGTETNRSMVYAPAGSALQGMTMVNNYKVAMNVQEHEREVRKARKKPEEFIDGLENILNFLEEHPEKYAAKPYEKKTLSEKLDHVLENAGLCYLVTPGRNYKFLILNRPSIIKETKNYFVVRFYNQQNEECTVKFTNCFGELNSEIATGR